MNQKIKRGISFFLVLLLVIAVPVFGETAAKKITAYVNKVKILVNGQQIPKDTLVYNNKLYINASDIARALGVNYSWDKKNNTATFTDKNFFIAKGKGYERNNPADLNQTMRIEFKNGYNEDTTERVCLAEISVTEIIRGSEAWDMIIDENQFNEKPDNGYEYILAKINFRLIKCVGSYSVSWLDFRTVSESGKVYDKTSIVSPKPDIDATLYEGSSNEGYAVFKVEINSLKPVINYGSDYNGFGGVWFKAYN